MRSVSKISLFFFIIFYNYIMLRAIIFPHIYDNYGVSGIYTILLMLLIIILIFILIPKELFKRDYLNEFNKSKIKYIIKAILYIRIILMLSSVAYIINVLYLYEYPYYLVLIGLVITLGIISKASAKGIIEISTLFCICGVLIYSLYFFNRIDMDYTLLKFNLPFKYTSIIYILLLVIDNFILLLTNNKEIRLNKPILISGITTSIILMILEYSILTLTSGDILFKNNILSGFISLSIQPVSRYSGNFRYVYLLFIITSVIFKMSYFMSIIKPYPSKNIYHIIKYIILYLISFGLGYLYYDKDQIIIYMAIVSILFCFVLPIWLIKERNNARLDEI